MPGQLLEFYGLREHPFGVSPNPRFLYVSTQYREALATLSSGIENLVGFSALIAETGVGKTALLFELLREFKDRATIALVSNTQCSGVELLRFIVMALEIPGSESERDPIRLYHILAAFASERQDTKPVVIIIDEAQNLENSALETLRLLSNLEGADRKLLHIILAGQPELREKLRSHSQLFQRITVITRLGRLSPEETEQFISFRLRVAGYIGPSLFADPAMARIKEASRGVPREINRICINALEAGFAQRKKKIGIEIIEHVLSELDIGCEISPERTASASSIESRALAPELERSSQRPVDSKLSGTSADTWVVDPSVDIGLGDEVIQSALSGLAPSTDLHPGTSTVQTAGFEIEPQVEPEKSSASERQRISYAGAGVGPSDEELRALLSGIELNVGVPPRAPAESSVKQPRAAEVDPNESSTDPHSAPHPDPRVLELFAPRKPFEHAAKKVGPEVVETPTQPVTYRLWEDAWNTGVPRDPYATMGSFASLHEENSEKREHEDTAEDSANPVRTEWRDRLSNPALIWLCLVIAIFLILYFVLPYLSN